MGVYPGDTINQARNFFASANIANFDALVKKGWSVKANLHFSYVSKHLVWSDGCGSVPLQDYWKHWSAQNIRQWDRQEWGTLKSSLQVAKIMRQTDITGFNANFTNTA